MTVVNRADSADSAPYATDGHQFKYAGHSHNECKMKPKLYRVWAYTDRIRSGYSVHFQSVNYYAGVVLVLKVKL